MTSVRTLQRSFAGGEITPELYGRLDLTKYQTGLAECKNFIVLPHGPATARPGFQYIGGVKTHAKKTRLIPFSFSTEQTYVLEFGDQYVRIYTNAGQLLTGSVTAFSGATATVTTSIPTAAATVTVSIATPAVITWAAHGLPANAPVVFSTTGALPTGITAGTTYYVSATGLVAGSFQISATPGGASINTTGSQSGTHTCTPSCNVGWTAHGLANGTKITFSTTGALPTGVVAATVYYVKNAQTNQFEISATSSGSAVVSSGSQSGTHTGYRSYIVSELVSYSGTNYYCRAITTTGNIPTDAAYWYPLTGTIVEIPTPYLEADLFDIHFVQSADVLALVHPSYAPRELRRLGAAEWELRTIQFAPTITAPTGVAVAATGSGTITYKYCVTSVSTGDEDESIASSIVSTTNNLNTAGNSNKVTWTNVSGAVRYRVYKLRGGIYAYVGQADDGTTGFVDDNISADLGTTPPTAQDPFSGANNYPQAVSYYEQRRVFAGTKNKPQTTWLTRTATESNMNRAIPSKDDDAMVIKLAAREANVIRHLVPMADLIMLTSSGEWKLSSGNADSLTPTSVQIKPQSYTGASNVQPAVTGNSILYAQDRGAGVRELTYSWETQAYKTIDGSIMAPHLFTGYTIKDMAFSRSPYSCLWVVRSDGVLLGLTYVPDQQVLGWHHHTTDGEFESVAVVSEGTEDVLYAVVKRTIGGNTKRYVERLHTREFSGQEDAFYVDSGLTYDGSPATTFSGLSHLEGKTVSILADGAVCPSKVVTSGQVTIPVAASVVHIGLQIDCLAKMLPVVVETQGFGQGRIKNVSAVYLRVYRAGIISAGPSELRQTEYRARTSEPYGTATSLISDEIKIVLQNDWQTGGQVVVKHNAPLPMTLVSASLEVEIGG